MKRLTFLFVVLAIGGLLGCSAGMDIPAPTSPPTTSPPTKLPTTAPFIKPTTAPAPKLEMYVFAKSGQRVGGGQSLLTVKRWEGTESREIRFTPPKSPWIVNAEFKPTSKIASKFDIGVWKEVMPEVRISADDVGAGTIGGIYFYIIPDGTKHIIDIDASGGEWWVKVGVEP